MADTECPGDYIERLKKLRAEHELTQTQLADLLGVSFATVNRWENKQSRPSALAWEKIDAIEKYGLPGSVQPPETTIQETNAPIDFMGNPESVKIVAEGERLLCGHFFNPAFATETSLIDPLPHQRIAVYKRMLGQPRLRFLLADDAGAGKTIMAGLYIREMLARRLINRVLIVPPAGLIGNWKREMSKLFNLDFAIIRGSEVSDGNPFKGSDSDLVIISVDTLSGERIFSELKDQDVKPYDLVIFDEAHKLSAYREPDLSVRKTQRYRLAEALAGIPGVDSKWQLNWTPRYLLLLTATPHMGKDIPYYYIWRLLEPEVLSTYDAFKTYPNDARERHFIRRTKEEMIRYDGSNIYPNRISDTFSYELTQGEISEQTLYDETTQYIAEVYNRARILNRAAARFAMSIFQRRLASSTFALMRTFERRLVKLDNYIRAVNEGEIDFDQLAIGQGRLESEINYTLDKRTADEEEATDEREENEIDEERALKGIVAVTLEDLINERLQVEQLLELAKQVYDTGHESKFNRMFELINLPEYKNEKAIIFTEHRDTLYFLVKRFEGLGFTGKIAQIHGGMDYIEREEQVEFFRKSHDEGGAKYLIATDAAGEGINLQFCWLIVNYDIPWNPARLEQRMGRIHRYGQKHDPVLIFNLVAGDTREGRVLRILLEKLERIKREYGGKVFDVIGRVFQDVSFSEYMEKVLTKDGITEVTNDIESRLTGQNIEDIKKQEKEIYGEDGDIAIDLPDLNEEIEHESFIRLLPGYVRGFVEKSAGLVDLTIDGDLEKTFSFLPQKRLALDPILPGLETYSALQRNNLTVYRPADSESAIWLRPGEPVFERYRAHVCSHLSREALRGGAFIDPISDKPYMFHLALVEVERDADPKFSAFQEKEIIEYRLLGLKQNEDGEIEECPVEHLLVLKGAERFPADAAGFAMKADESVGRAKAYAYQYANSRANLRRQELMQSLAEREEFIKRGFQYEEAELAARRAKQFEKARKGSARAKGELTRIKEQQQMLTQRREESLTIIYREPELIAPGDITFIAHALVVPSGDPKEQERYDKEIDAIAMRMARTFEESKGAVVSDVSTPELARAANLNEWPGFDLLSVHPDGRKLAIEVKGRAMVGDIEVSDNEWAKACNMRDRYWLYVVYDCASPNPRLLRIQDPFGRLVTKGRGVAINETEIFKAAEE